MPPKLQPAAAHIIWGSPEPFDSSSSLIGEERLADVHFEPNSVSISLSNEPTSQDGQDRDRGRGEEALEEEEENPDEEDEEAPGGAGDGRSAPAYIWSAGSVGHADGTCRPCQYMHTRNGCWKQADCFFCHLEHEKPFRSRPHKSTRLKCKRLARKVGLAEASQMLQNPELSVRETYMLDVVKSRIKEQQDPWPRVLRE